MRTIYIEPDTYKCHTEEREGLIAVETDFFDGKCKKYVEGYRYIPSGQSWTDENGVQLDGEMFIVVEDYNMLLALQAQYEEMIAERADLQSALDAIYGGVTDDGT